MPRVTYVEPRGRQVTVEVPAGSSVMSGAVGAGVAGVEAQCGGNMACATCHCYVQKQWAQRLPPPSKEERLMLQNVAAEKRGNSRLSCQLIVQRELDGLTVQFPDRQ